MGALAGLLQLMWSIKWCEKKGRKWRNYILLILLLNLAWSSYRPSKLAVLPLLSIIYITRKYQSYSILSASVIWLLGSQRQVMLFCPAWCPHVSLLSFKAWKVAEVQGSLCSALCSTPVTQPADGNSRACQQLPPSTSDHTPARPCLPLKVQQDVLMWTSFWFGSRTDEQSCPLVRKFCNSLNGQSGRASSLAAQRAAAAPLGIPGI